MTKTRTTQPQIPPAVGLKPALQEKSRTRRRTQKSLTLLQQSAPSGRNDLVPSLKIEYLPAEALQPANRRVRRSEADQVARVEASIRQYGICAPLLVDKNGRIIHGHVVWEAARRLGLDRIPTIRIDHLTEPQQHALSIALNRIAETGTWDVEALKIEFEELIEFKEDVIATGFELAEIDALLLIEDEADEPEAEALPELPQSAVSQAGDVWLMGNHRIAQGDARERDVYTRLFTDTDPARLLLTDVPFNVAVRGHCTSQSHHREFAMAHGELSREEFFAFNIDWMRPSLEHLVDGALLATFIDWRSVELVLAAGRELDLDLVNLIVWAKPNGGQGSLWRSQHELLPVFKKGVAAHTNNIELGRWGRYRGNVWSYPGASTLGSEARDGLAVHPTVKPRAMLADALLDVTDRGDVVLDCFLGSGSMLLAAETTGRVCRAIEIDSRYCDVAIDRWQQMAGHEAVLSETGETFSEVALRRGVAPRTEGER